MKLLAGLPAWVSAGVALGIVGVSVDAQAAVQLPCTPATMTPLAPSVPANLPGFGYDALKATAGDVHLYNTNGGSKTEVAVAVGPIVDKLNKVAPTSPLVAGSSYELDYNGFCDFSGYPVTPLKFTVTDAAPIPTALGELQGQPTVTVTNLGTSKVSIVATYALSAEMKPWIAVYELGLELDGRVIETNRAAVPNDSIQINGIGWCDAANAATTTHSIKLKAQLPFSPTLETTAATATFECPAPLIGTPGAANPVAPPGVTPTSSGGTSTTTTSGSSGGCSMASVPGGLSALPLLGIAIGIAAVARRRGVR